MATECVDFYAKAEELKMFGFAIPDHGFYNIMIPRVGEVVKASCIIHVIQREATKKKLEEELKNLINNQWDWNVRQVDTKEYTTIFPDKNSLETFSKISEILMSLHGIKVWIMKNEMDPNASKFYKLLGLKYMVYLLLLLRNK
jgi:hypothetical protein